MIAIIPRIESSWTRIITYPDNHLNDFCLFKAPGGRWHCIGIIGTGTWDSETSFFHCSSDNLFGPYEKHDVLLTELDQGPTTNSAPQKHAPFIVVQNDMFYMFFRRPGGTNLLLKSTDCFHWPKVPTVVFEENDARDTCIQKFAGVFHWYYCQWRQINGKGRSCIRLRRSRDLENWSSSIDVHVDESREVGHSHLESPFVVCAANKYWLFVRDRSLDERCVTTVFRSDSPVCFRSGVRTWDGELEGIHAPELVEDAGNWHIARVSGPPGLPAAPKHGGWIEIARISFPEETESK